jgi:hypothetical protein
VSVEGSDRVGSVAEEAARLLGVFAAGMPEAHLLAAGSRAAGETRQPTPVPSVGTTRMPRHPGTRYAASAPICRVLNVVKAISPETLDKIADVVDLVSEGLRGFAATRRTEAPPPAPTGGEQPQEPV